MVRDGAYSNGSICCSIGTHGHFLLLCCRAYCQKFHIMAWLRPDVLLQELCVGVFF